MNLAPAESNNQTLVIDSKSKFDYNNVLTFLSENGYVRVSGVKESGEYSGSIISFLFKLLIILPRFISNPIFYLLRFSNKLMRKAYMLNLHIFRKK